MRHALTLAFLCAGSGLAQAQATQPAPPPGGSSEEGGPIPDPNLPDVNLPREEAARAPAYRPSKRDYPIELVRRPLTLAEDQAQASLDVPFVAGDGDPTLTQLLRGAFGVTVDLEIGVTYSVGLERLSPSSTEDGFQVGKAVSLDGAYTIIPSYLAAELRVGFYVDPDFFGMGLILGAPFKINIGDDWALFGLRDLVRVKLTGLAADPDDPAANLLAAANHARNVTAPSGGLHAQLGVAYQARPNVAVWGNLAYDWPDFDTDRQQTELFVGTTFSPRRTWDLGARVGFLSLDEPAKTFSVAVFAAVRI